MSIRRPQIAKLMERIDALAARLDPTPQVVSIMHPATWTEEQREALITRHHEKYPISRRAGVTVLLTRWYSDDPDRYSRDWEGSTPQDRNNLDDETWRELSREWKLTPTTDEGWRTLCRSWHVFHK